MIRPRSRPLMFESLESIDLLSGAGTALPHAGMLEHAVHQAEVRPGPSVSTPDVALDLSGALDGTYRLVGGTTEATFTGHGDVGPIGKTKVHGKFDLATSLDVGELVLSAGNAGRSSSAGSIWYPDTRLLTRSSGAPRRSRGTPAVARRS